MGLEHKPVTSIVEEDLTALIDNKEAESKTIEYKRSLPAKDNISKLEFLYDVSSFANAAGGHLVFGMEENEGLPAQLVGLADTNADDAMLRLESMMRDGIRPPITGVRSVPVRMKSGLSAIVMHIPKSWNAPHQVTYQKSFRFYGRASNGKYQMDVDELRSMFSLSETLVDRLHGFRIARVDHFRKEGPPSQFPSGARMISHLLPLSAFAGTPRIELKGMMNRAGDLVNLIGGVQHTRFNADGFIGWSDHAYVQVFATGCLEAVHAFESKVQAGDYVPSQGIELQLMRHLKSGKSLLQSLSVEPPLIWAVSFVHIKGKRMAVPPWHSTSALDFFDRDPLYLPDLVIDSFGEEYLKEARPMIDAVWNAAGWPGSPNFDQSGQYDPDRH